MDGPIPAKVHRYAKQLIKQSDHNADGTLDRWEWGRLWGFLLTDTNADSQISLDELVRRIATYGQHRRIRLMPPLVESGEEFQPLLKPSTSESPVKPLMPEDANSVTNSLVDKPSDDEMRQNTKFAVSSKRRLGGLPAWFTGRDFDGDGQLTMAEFAPKSDSTSQAEFTRLDHNGDGVITPREYVRASK